MHGPRGKSAFARKLGLAASTYDYYENGRVPPADVLVRIADQTGVDLRWLLTGRNDPARPMPTDHPALQRAASLLADRPNAGDALAAFVEILQAADRFPRKVGQAPSQAAPSAEGARPSRRAADSGYRIPHASWIPLLGRSAAGVPAFWQDPDQAAGTRTIGEMIEKFAGRAPTRQSHTQARADGELGQVPVHRILVPPAASDEVPVEFVACQDCKRRYPDAFALQIDGDSMSPDIAHGDLVLASPSAPAVDGRTAIVQLDGQVGVTCKLFRRAGNLVHLVALNEQIEPVTVPAEAIDWALRVLARVRC
jgi:transcriptional regulator with XRE-family HTH domain